MSRVDVEILRLPINGSPVGTVINIDTTSARALVALGRAKYAEAAKTPEPVVAEPAVPLVPEAPPQVESSPEIESAALQSDNDAAAPRVEVVQGKRTYKTRMLKAK